MRRRKNEPTSKQKEENEDQISDQIKTYVKEAMYALNFEIKSYTDSRLQIYFNSFENKLRDFVESKYETIHNRQYIEKKNCLTRENVLSSVEIAFTIKNIDEKIDLYRYTEFKQLRLSFKINV
jgi:hypothetical protein